MEEIIETKHEEIDTDELFIISGYLGVKPLEKLADLPIDCKIIYGMYDNGISEKLNEQFLKMQRGNSNIDIFYSIAPVHTKCYIWKKNNIIKYALSGSANFTTNGLNNDYRELLAEFKTDGYDMLKEYKEKILKESIRCDIVENLIATG
ncbi:MAG: restriction endonuclease PLD domain-containing protein, partial [Candidatus Woesearchaeota archaeon]